MLRILILLFVLYPLLLGGTALADTQPRETLTVGIQYVDGPPYIWRDNEGSLRGFVPAIYTKLLKQLGFDVEFVLVDVYDPELWSKNSSRLISGEIDFMGPVTKNGAAFESLAMAKSPLLEVEMGVYVLTDRPTIALDDHSLQRYKGGALGERDAVVDADSPLLAGFNLVFRPTLDELVLLHRNGEVDYLFIPRAVASLYTIKNNLRDQLIALSTLHLHPYFIVTARKPKNLEILEAMDRLIEQQRKDGQFKRLMNYHQKDYINYSSTIGRAH